jgi:Mg2+ and Co2+ transporter CorA
MIKAYFYDANGADREAELEDKLPAIASDQLLWIDITGREEGELDRVANLLSLENSSIGELQSSRRAFNLGNYGQYVMFDVLTLCPKEDRVRGKVPRTPQSMRLDFVFSDKWLLTVHDEGVGFLEDFRAQDRGETLIGQLSPASLAAALLDLHLSGYLAAIEVLETFVDGLDVRLLGKRALRDDLLAQLVVGSRYVASLRRMLAAQRTVFYGLSRPDFTIVAASNAAPHFAALERHFDRALDAIEHARELMKGSFELLSARVSETTNVLIRRLTFISLMLGAIGAVAGVFGMNFQTRYTSSGEEGFWIVIGALALLAIVSGGISLYRKWI